MKILSFVVCVLLVAGLLMSCSSPPPTATPIPPTPTAVPITTSFHTSAFRVNHGSTYSLTFDLPPQTVVEYKYASYLDINFSVTDPRGNVLTSYDRSLGNEGSFKSKEGGRYTLVFDNGFSLFEGKNVTVQYRMISPGGR